MNKRHGKSSTRIYHIWAGMKQRCSNIHATDYILYGGRGISVCNDWQDFMPFYDWAMNNGYNDSLTLDRINCNGNYEPLNCRWVDWSKQASNRRKKEDVRREKEKYLSALRNKREGIPIQCEESKEVFNSIKELARQLCVSSTLIHKHLRGELKHIRGFHYRKINELE